MGNRLTNTTVAQGEVIRYLRERLQGASALRAAARPGIPAASAA